MIYNTLLARSFTKHEQRKLGFGALVACILMVFSCIKVLKPPNRNLLGSYESSFKAFKDSRFSFHTNVHGTTTRNEVSCSLTKMAEFCDLRGDVRVNGKASTIFTVLEAQSASGSFSWSIRPYGRRIDNFAMSVAREWHIKLVSDGAGQCTQNYTVPGILFSVGSYAGNHFHAFTDVLVPLFAAARPFNGKVVLLVTDYHRNPDWVGKFGALLQGLSVYEPINIDSDEQTTVHCFPSILIGPKHRSEKELSLSRAGTPYKITDFTAFLRDRYSLKRLTAIKLKEEGDERRPRLLIVSRQQSRRFLNVDDIQAMAADVGFDVIVKEPGANMSEIAAEINSCDVLLGVHGAGLTNLVFLPENAVFVQIVPMGGAEWVSSTFFGQPSKEMKLRYVEYKIQLDESSLKDQYNPDDIVLRNPQAVKDKGWQVFKQVYFDQQNININITRFRPTLMEVMELLRK